MAAKGREREKEPLDSVHQNAILCETILKERRSQKLHTDFSINPFMKPHVLTEKAMPRHPYEDAEEDPTFLKMIHGARLEPTKKYTHPQTESQEIGWISTPLIVQDRSDRRLHFARQNSEITKYMDAAWRLKEQTQNFG
ncbi:cilia- and flagella-associated protein 144 isoform X2 [Amia ocellicauda]